MGRRLGHAGYVTWKFNYGLVRINSYGLSQSISIYWSSCVWFRRISNHILNTPTICNNLPRIFREPQAYGLAHAKIKKSTFKKKIPNSVPNIGTIWDDLQNYQKLSK